MTDTAAASAPSRPTCSRLAGRRTAPRRLARTLLVLGVAAAAVATSLVPFASAQPAPAPAPAATPQAATLPADRFPQPNMARPKWEFQIKHENPKRIVVRHAADPLATPYWYMTYTVTNPGTEPQNFE